MRFFLVLLFSFSALAQNQEAATPPTAQPAQKEIFNQVLFTEGNQSWTLRDFNLYKKLVSTYLKHDKISEYSDSIVEDFLISRLLKREALLFEIKPSSIIPTNAVALSSNEFTKKEIEQESKDLAYAVALLNLKEKQMGQKPRFKAWIDVLKRKYQVKIKSE